MLLSLVLFAEPAEANTLPEVKRPDFSTSSAVIASLDGMIAALEEEAKIHSSWQVGRALGNCREARQIIAQWPDVGAYSPRGAERLWRDCRSTYGAVR
ncbi:MAG: hypothetical protein ACRECM_12590 [Methyloceanibacter sp.]